MPFTDPELLQAIAQRAADLYVRLEIVAPKSREKTRRNILMTLNVVHHRTCPLRLQQLLEADDSNFSHDVGGINRHFDFRTLSLKDCFRPRFAA